MNPLGARNTFTGVLYIFLDFRPTWVRMPNPGSHPANSPVIRFVTAMLIFASHRLRIRSCLLRFYLGKASHASFSSASFLGFRSWK